MSKKTIRPPGFAVRWLEWFCPPMANMLALENKFPDSVKEYMSQREDRISVFESNRKLEV